MAQLNIYTYLAQATGLIIIYIIYYIIIKQEIIPGILEKIRIYRKYEKINKIITLTSDTQYFYFNKF